MLFIIISYKEIIVRLGIRVVVRVLVLVFIVLTAITLMFRPKHRLERPSATCLGQQ